MCLYPLIKSQHPLPTSIIFRYNDEDVFSTASSVSLHIISDLMDFHSFKTLSVNIGISK